jgi:hypothetical protein
MNIHHRVLENKLLVFTGGFLWVVQRSTLDECCIS